MSWVEWMDDPLRPARQELMAAREERGEAVDPEAVDLAPENQDAAAVYMLVRNQVVTVADGRAIDLNLAAVKAAMDMHGVQDQRECLGKIVRLWREVDAERWKDVATKKEP